MLTDLDTLMTERSIDTIIVPMHEAMHPSFRWLSRGAKVTKGYAFKMPGREPILVTYPMAILWHWGAMALPKGELDDNGDSVGKEAIAGAGLEGDPIAGKT